MSRPLRVHKAELPLWVPGRGLVGVIQHHDLYNVECGRIVRGDRTRKRWRGVTCQQCLYRRKGV